MAKFGGSAKADNDYSLKIGFFEADVVAINPDREELEKLLNTNIDKDPEYLGEKDGDTTLRVSIWLKEKKSGRLFNATYFLQDKVVVSKKGLTQYVNDNGRMSYVMDKDDLNEKFISVDYRKAKVGEVDFIGFLDAWMKLNKKEEYHLLPDWKKLMKGNIDEIKEIMQTDLPRSVGSIAYVRVVEKEGELKEYQAVYTRKFVPGYVVKDLVSTKWTEEKIDALRTKRDTKKDDGSRNFLKTYEDFVVQLADTEYGLKDPHYLGALKDFNKDEFPHIYAKTTSPKEAGVSADDDGDY